MEREVGGRFKKEGTYVHLCLVHVDVWQKPSQWCNHSPIKNKINLKKKLGIKLPYDPTISLLGIYPEKIIIQKDKRIPIFITTLFTIPRTWIQPRCLSTIVFNSPKFISPRCKFLLVRLIYFL